MGGIDLTQQRVEVDSRNTVARWGLCTLCDRVRLHADRKSICRRVRQ